MRVSQRGAVAAFFLFMVSLANASPQEDVAAAFKDWQQALTKGTPAPVVDLYDPNATLLATLDQQLMTTQDQRTTYFSGLVSRTKFGVTVDKEETRVLGGNEATINGLYTFHFEDHGKEIRIPARYTFIYEKNQDGKWKIIVHHSSLVPESKH